MVNEERLTIDNLVVAIRREAAQLPNLEEESFIVNSTCSQQSMTELATAIATTMQAVEDLALPRLSRHSSSRNWLKKFLEKLSLKILNRIERRRCQAELTLLKNLRLIHLFQLQLQADLKSVQDTTSQTVNYHIQYLHRQVTQAANTPKIDQALESLLETFYYQFEDKYRGTVDSVRHRLRPYLNRLLSSKGPLTIVDLGCGRGEWLTLIKELGHRGRGIDCNSKFVELCRQQDLEVELGEVGAWLHAQPSQSIDVISAFHVIEHLSFPTLADWMKEISRVLKPQGWLLLETPNMSQFQVGLVDFYRDPTHIQRIHPQTLQTLLECLDFAMVETAYVNALGDLIEWMPTQEVVLQHPGQFASLPADLAIIARKPA
ncbi:class I SAM-dependent methyltransferase [Synechococcus elongatus]|uniref:Class I SAM-dependent methyltransferase n=1 Tax=Synechococcus elongatus PCC 11802 TaxID=2283154 RepID=A0AAT9JRM6_SYNEL|nr:class I SAM-dependent methyltransferase [Synechococcus elongatus]QFZ92887.1 class I SAM-dependent methyltransferase [Synechococcus elongatus PCC 11802]